LVPFIASLNLTASDLFQLFRTTMYAL
jgi:hypothetical protein